MSCSKTFLFLVLIASLAGCSQRTTKTASTEPNETYWLGSNLSVEINESSEKPHLSFLKGYKEIYSEPIAPNERVSVVFPESSKFLLEDENTDQPKNLVPSPERGAALDRIPAVKTPLVKLTDDASSEVIIKHQNEKGFSYSIFKVADKFPKLGTLRTNSDIVLQTFDSEAFSKIVVTDCLPDFGIQAVAPQIIFHYADGAFRFDTELMAKHLPTKSERIDWQKNFATQLKTSKDIPVELADEIFDYYYCGQAKQARVFLDSCWPAKRPGKEAYWKFIVNEIKKSPYHDEIESVNRRSESI